MYKLYKNKCSKLILNGFYYKVSEYIDYTNACCAFSC